MKSAIVTVVAGRHDHLRRQLEGIEQMLARPDIHVVVSMGDADVPEICRARAEVISVVADPHALPLAAARNAGADVAVAQDADALVFLDVDCIPGPSLLTQYLSGARRAPDALLSGPVTYLPPPPPGGYDLSTLAQLRNPHSARPMPTEGFAPLAHELFWSLSFCVTAPTWRRIGGFDPQYSGYGGEDTDFAFTARTAAVPHVAVAGADAFHQWHPVADPPVQHLHDIVRNAKRFQRRWGRWAMADWLRQFEELGLLRYDEENDQYHLLDGSSADQPLDS